MRTAEGNGPVNALDRALREALVEIHPHLRDIELVNFKVRILDETKGTGAVTRVLLDVSDGDRVWGSIGVSENVIEASWEALVDSLEYGMQTAEPHARLGGTAAGARARDRRRPRADSARPAGPRCAEEERGAGRAALRAAVAGAAAGRVRAGVRGLGWALAAPARSRAERPACIWRCGRSASATATR